MTAPQSGRIFISYRRADSAGYAGRIYDRLAAHFGKEAIFMDVDTIEAGLDFVDVLENAVQSCDVLVALIGRQWLNIKDEAGERRLDNPQDFVRIEVAAALNRGIRVIPVLVDGTSMPNSGQLPSNLKPLARRNAVLVNHYSFHADASRLIEQLELALKAAEDSKILKVKRLREEEVQKKRQEEIENLLPQADIALDLKDWELAKEKLTAVLTLKPDHAQAQIKLDIAERKQQQAKETAEQQTAINKAKREALAKTVLKQLKGIISNRWALTGIIGLAIVGLSTWGISNINFNPIISPPPEISSTITIPPKTTSTLEEPTPTSHPLTTTDYPCTECHSDSSRLNKINTELEMSQHGSNVTFTGGDISDCAGCHSGTGFTTMIAAGQNPSQVETDEPNTTEQDCKTCHQIHTTNTVDDWALTTNEPVALFAYEDVIYDGGQGNLCANCHQPRRQIAEPDNGNIEVNSTYWGPHHGPQAAVLLGLGGAGDVAEGSSSAHYSMAENTCVNCHVGEYDDHSLWPNVTSCQNCHADIEDFDISGLQTEVEELIAELGEKLEADGMYNLEDGHPIVGFYPAAKAQAMWNYILIAVEDSSRGVHNPAYTKALLDWSIEALK